MAIGIGFEKDEFVQSVKETEEEERVLKMSKEERDNIEQILAWERSQLYIPERREAEMRAMFKDVVVNDYKDDYHLSDEEREKNNQFYKLFSRLNRCKRKYRSLKDFIDVYRLVLQCIDAVADNQDVYDPDEFKAKVLNGKIKVGGLFFPTYNGKDKKRISREYLIDYILSDAPADEFYGKEDGDDLRSDAEILNDRYRLFSDQELEELATPLSKELEIEYSKTYDGDPSKITSTATAIRFEPAERKEILKTCPELINMAKDARKNLNSKDLLDIYAYELTEDDYDSIEKYDAEHNVVSTSDMPVFKGNMMKKSDYKRYLYELDMAAYQNFKYNYNGRMLSRAEIDNVELKNDLERGGFNVRKFWDNEKNMKKLKKAKRRDEERAKKLKERLARINDRNERRKLGEDFDDKSEKKRKKKKKDKDNESLSKAMKDRKKRLKETQEDILLSVVGKQGMSFEEYREECETFDWDGLK